MSRQGGIPQENPAPRAGRLAMVAAVAVAAMLFAGSLALWRENGLGVFMESIASGIASCF